MQKKLIGVIVLWAASFAASAIPVTMQFTVTGFVGGPVDPVSGSIVWDAASATAPINSFIAINLTIDGHVYTVGEIGTANLGLIGGTLNNIIGVLAFTDDFIVTFDHATGTPGAFVYATATAPAGAVVSSNFTSFSITAAPQAVPEPASLALLALGLLGLGFILRKKA